MSILYYISDGSNSAIRTIDNSGNINTLSITSTDPVWLSNGGWVIPSGMAQDNSGNLYVCDPGGNAVYKITLSTGNLVTVAGTGHSGFSGVPGPALSANIGNSYDCACDPAGNLYISNVNSTMCVMAVNTQATTQTLLGVSIASGHIAVVAGNNGIGYSGIPGAATAATFTNPYGITIDSGGNLYICSQGNAPGTLPANQPSAAILKVNTSGNISNIAGNPAIASNVSSGDGGVATSAGLGTPIGIAFDAKGNIYITGSGESAWSSVRVVNTQATTQTILNVSIGSGNIGTVAGNGSSTGYSGDGGAAISALLGAGPWASAVDGSGNLFIVDTGNNVVRKVTTAGTISTVFGFFPGNPGYTGDGGPANAATFHSPFDIIVPTVTSSVPNTLTGGPFQKPDGTPIAHGTLLLELSHDENYVTGKNQIVAGLKNTIALDANGFILGTPTIWPNDSISPSGSYYTMKLYAQDGSHAWDSPHRLVVASSPSPFNIVSGIDYTR